MSNSAHVYVGDELVAVYDLPTPTPELPRHRSRPSFARLSAAAAGKCNQRWRHVASGYEVIHCGHPTALRSWYIGTPDDTDLPTCGQAFTRLTEAFDWIERSRLP